MTGRPLATAAVTASAVAWRAPDDYSALSFGKGANVIFWKIRLPMLLGALLTATAI